MMNKAITRRSLRLYTFITGFIFATLFVFYGLANHFDGLLFFQTLSLLVCIFALLEGIKCNKLSQILIIVVVCQLFFLIGMSFFDPSEGIIDKISYEECVKEMLKKKSFSEILNMFLNPEYSGLGDMSDFGYTFILYLCIDFLGWDVGPIVMGFIKVACHLLSCVLIHRFIRNIIGNSNALFVSLFWGINMNSAFFVLAGLKESIFVVFVLYAIHRMYLQIIKPSLKNLLLFSFAVCLTFLFRAVYPAFFVLTYLLFLVFFEIKSKFVRNVMIAITAVICIFAIWVIFRNSFQSVLLLMEEDEEFNKMPIYMKIVNGLVSPYPCIRPDGARSNLLVAGYSSLHSAFCLFAMSGVYYAIRHKSKYLFPLVGILALNIIMLTITGFSMNVRFLYPTHIIYYAFIPLGIKHFWEERIFVPYLIILMIITLKYNSII